MPLKRKKKQKKKKPATAGLLGHRVKKWEVFIEEGEMTAKLQKSLLELHSFPVIASFCIYRKRLEWRHGGD